MQVSVSNSSANAKSLANSSSLPQSSGFGSFIYNFFNLEKKFNLYERFNKATPIPVNEISGKNIRFEGMKIRNHPAEANDVIIRDFHKSLEFLSKFGDQITSLTLIGQSYQSDETDEIARNIALYAANSLRDIDLRSSGSYLIRDANVSFPELINMKLDAYDFPQDMQLHRIYPNMQRLTVSIGAVQATKSNAQLDRNLKRICSSIRLNGKIHTLNLQKQRLSMVDLKELSDLPALETMNIQSLIVTDNEHSVHFRTVRNFTGRLVEAIEINRPRPCPITFSKLETIKITWIAKQSTYMPFKLIEENVGLKTIIMPLVDDVKAVNDLLTKIKNAHNLQDLDITWTVTRDRKEPLPDFSAFKRMKFSVRNINYKMEERESLMSKLPAEWKVIDEWNEQTEDGRLNFSHILVERI